jgi:hypothetical protein
MYHSARAAGKGILRSAQRGQTNKGSGEVERDTIMAGQGKWKEGALWASQSLDPLMEKNNPSWKQYRPGPWRFQAVTF